MNALTILHTLEQLSPSCQNQVIEFIESIKKKQPENLLEAMPYGFGMIQVTQQASLAQIDEAIEHGAAL